MGIERWAFQSPEALSDQHILDQFDCGEVSLDEWLKRRARKNENLGASRTFVIAEEQLVVAYYCLSAGAVDRGSAPKRIGRNMPDPVPVLVMGRLAVDRRYQGMGIGAGLIRDALIRTLNVAAQIGVKALLVHALSEPAREFYSAHGFLESPVDRMILGLPVATIRDALK